MYKGKTPRISTMFTIVLEQIDKVDTVHETKRVGEVDTTHETDKVHEIDKIDSIHRDRHEGTKLRISR